MFGFFSFPEVGPPSSTNMNTNKFMTIRWQTKMFNVFHYRSVSCLVRWENNNRSYTAVNILAMPEFISEQIKADRFWKHMSVLTFHSNQMVVTPTHVQTINFYFPAIDFEKYEFGKSSLLVSNSLFTKITDWSIKILYSVFNNLMFRFNSCTFLHAMKDQTSSVSGKCHKEEKRRSFKIVCNTHLQNLSTKLCQKCLQTWNHYVKSAAS